MAAFLVALFGGVSAFGACSSEWDKRDCFDDFALIAESLEGHSVAHYIRSLAPLTQLTRSAALRFATLASLARSVYGLPHFAHSLVGQ